MYIDIRMDKQNVVYTFSGILFSLKWKEILIYATTWMNLEYIMLSEISQTQKPILYDPTYIKYLEQSNS